MATGIVAVLWSLCGVSAAAASTVAPWTQYGDPVFVPIDTRELPNPLVWSLAQDPSGFVWVGTQGGLARFDGYHFRNFLPNPADPAALPDGYVRRILCDRSGILWLGTASAGLVRFDPATEIFKTWRTDRAAKLGPRSGHVDALAETADGAILVGGDGGLDRFDPRSGAFAPIALTHDAGRQPWVRSILVDRQGTVWVGTWQEGALYYRLAGSPRFELFDLAGSTRGPQPRVYSLYQDVAGRLWAGSRNAVYVIDGRRHVTTFRSSSERNALASGGQWAIIEPVPGTIWVGANSAIATIDTASKRVRRITPLHDVPDGLGDGQVLGFMRDRSGLIWIANQSGGLRVYNPTSTGFTAIPSGRAEIALGPRGARSLAATPGQVWIGGRQRLIALRARSENVESIELPDDFDADTLARGADGSLWVAGDTLCRLAPGAHALDCPAGPGEVGSSLVSSVLATPSTLYIGASTGLIARDARTGRVTVYRHGDDAASLSNSSIETVYQDRSGRLWVGTANGLNLLRANARGFTRFTFDPENPHSLGPGSISSVVQDRSGRIWAGAIGGPLDVVQLTGGAPRIRRLGRNDGMADENVNGLAVDPSGRVWASTNRGLAVFDARTLRARALGPIDGVPDGIYWSGATAQAADGTIFFGGQNGVAVVAPGAASPWTYAPPVVVTALAIAGKTQTPGSAAGSSLRLPADGHSFSVEFAALDYSLPYALHYQYQLDGFDRAWNDADAAHRLATYTNLAPGSYTLRVRATNRVGAWSAHVLALPIVALPAWYETWWFRALLLALLGACAYAAQEVRTAVLRRNQRRLEAIVEERTQELSGANRALEEMSLTDPLTGLRNRRFLTMRLDEEVAVTTRRYDDWRGAGSGPPPYDADIIFFLIDIDHFKAVNDELGHDAGDRVLAQMRGRLEQVFRASDHLARWGGEEFLVVTRGTPRTDAPAIAERLRNAIAERPFELDGGAQLAKTASIGFAAFPFCPLEPQAFAWQAIVGLADRGLYMAKHSGRNAWIGLAAPEGADATALAQRLAASAESDVDGLDVIRKDGASLPPR